MQGYSFIARYNRTTNSSTPDYCLYDVTADRCISLSTRKIVNDGAEFELLIEKRPIRYELHETTYSSWRNVSEFGLETVGEKTLLNFKTFTNFQQFNVSYAYLLDTFIQFPLNLVPRTNVDIYEEDDTKLTHSVSVGVSKASHVVGQLSSIKAIPALQAVRAQATGKSSKRCVPLGGPCTKCTKKQKRIRTIFRRGFRSGRT